MTKLLLLLPALLTALPAPSPAQRSQMFGPYLEGTVFPPPAALFSVAAGGTHREIGIATSEPASVCFMSMAGGDSLRIVREIPVGGAVRAAVFVDGVPGRRARFALLSADGDSIRMIRTLRKTVQMDAVALPGRADGILCADIDSDGDREVAVFGRRIAGLSLVRIPARGGSGLAEPLFPDLSAADAAVLDLNGDGVNDIVLLDWLNDRLILRQGIGRGAFSDPVEVELPGEPGTLSVYTRDAGLAIAVTIPARHQIAVLVRDSADRLAPGVFCTTPWEPESMTIRDVNGDGRADILCGGSGEIAVFLAATNVSYRPPLRFHALGAHPLWMLEDLDADRQPELILADREHGKVRAALRSLPARSREAISYLAGRETQDLLIAEVTGDRRNDLVITGGGTLSIYQQRIGGFLVPSTSVEIPAAAQRSILVSGGSRPRFLISFPRTEELAAVTPGGDPPVVIFPAGSDPCVLVTGADPAPGHPWILARYRPGTKKEFALSAYEQLSDRQFLERKVESISPHAAAITARRGRAGEPPSLIVATRDSRQRAVVLLAYTIGAGGEPSGERTIATLRDTIGRLGWIRTGDLDHDGRMDLILGLQRPTQRLAILYGDDRAGEAGDLLFVDGCGGADERWLVIRDADGDGHSDLIFPGEARRSVEIASGTGPRSFATARTAVRTGEIHAFTAGPLYGTCDLVVAEPRGSVHVYPTAFRRAQ